MSLQQSSEPEYLRTNEAGQNSDDEQKRERNKLIRLLAIRNEWHNSWKSAFRKRLVILL